MKANGLMTFKMVKGKKPGKMAPSSKGNIKMASNTGKDDTTGLMEAHTKET